MLRRAENVSISFSANILTGNGWLMLNVGKQSYHVIKVHQGYVERISDSQLQTPVMMGRVGERFYWQYQNRFYWENEELTPDEVHALLVTRQQRERQRIDRAQATVAMARPPNRDDQRVGDYTRANQQHAAQAVDTFLRGLGYQPPAPSSDLPVGQRNSRIIPQNVKIAVATRDGGKCRQCGSAQDLHFDHVIPWSKGGTNSVKNIQLLCGPCSQGR